MKPSESYLCLEAAVEAKLEIHLAKRINDP